MDNIDRLIRLKKLLLSIERNVLKAWQEVSAGKDIPERDHAVRSLASIQQILATLRGNNMEVIEADWKRRTAPRKERG